MYTFLFCFFYKYFEWKKGFKSIAVAAMTVSLVLMIHVLLVYKILSILFGWGNLNFQLNYGSRTLIFYPIMAGIFSLSYFLYFKRNGQRILVQFENKNIFSPKHIVFMCLLCIAPLAMVILLS